MEKVIARGKAEPAAVLRGFHPPERQGRRPACDLRDPPPLLEVQVRYEHM